MMLYQQFLELSKGQKMNNELKMLLIAFMLLIVGIVVFWYQQQGCHQVEYQDLNGSHFMQVCEGKN